MRNMKRLVKLLVLSMMLSWTMAPTTVDAQCPMCKMSAESNLENGGTAGKGLNKGILFMFITPYLIIGGLGYYWYKNRVKDSEVNEDW